MASPSQKSTPTTGLQAILGMEDIDILTNRLGMQPAMRIGQPKWDGILLMANKQPNQSRKGFYRRWMNLIEETLLQSLAGPKKPTQAQCTPYQNWYWNRTLTLESPDKMNIIGNAGILNPYYNGSQYRIHILSMDQDQPATTREPQPDPNPINGKSCAGYRIIINNKNKVLEERHIETKITIFKNITGKENIKFLTATKAIKTLNEITKHKEDKNFETLIFADFNRQALTNTMITNITEKDLIRELRKIKSNTKATNTPTTNMQNKKRTRQRNQTNPKPKPNNNN